MAKLILKCSKCDKPLELLKSSKFSDTKVINAYKCGHAFVEEKTIESDKLPLCLTSVDGSDLHARPYQVDGIDFIVNGYFDPETHEQLNEGFNCILGDQQRIGKTPQSLLALQTVLDSKCTLIIVGGANQYQWTREVKKWTTTLPLGVFVIKGSKSFIPPGFKTYIISRDTFSKESVTDRLKKLGINLVVVDEMHNFKNASSKRSQALVNFLNDINVNEITKDIKFNCPCGYEWTEQVKVSSKDTQSYRSNHSSHCTKCGTWVQINTFKEKIKLKRACGLLMLTGTPIKNRADEFFIPLNLIAPTVFPSLDNFRRRWLVNDGNKWSRVDPYKLEQFKEVIKPYILRREKQDVYQDLPSLDRLFTVIEIENQALKDAYNKVLDSMEEKMDRGNYTFFDSIGELAQLRQICGLAKVDWTIDYIEEFFENDPDARLAIGLHHKSLRDTLKLRLSKYGVMTVDGEDDPFRKDEVMRTFRTSKEKILLMGMSAIKEGQDYCYLPQALALERMWSAADEEQFEFRFYNPDKDYLESIGLDRNKTTDIEYPIAAGTVDEFFYDLVEEKRKIFGETLGTNWDISSDTGGFKQLMERTIQGRLK